MAGLASLRPILASCAHANALWRVDAGLPRKRSKRQSVACSLACPSFRLAQVVGVEVAAAVVWAAEAPLMCLVVRTRSLPS